MYTIQRTVRRLIAVSVMILFGVFSVHARSPLAHLEQSLEKITLKNGMVFLVLRSPELPVFAAYLRVRVGAIEEDAEKSGLAHLFEHMAFKGTRKIGPREFTAIYNRNGGQSLNATTSQDMTSYYVKLPSNRLELWAWMESERFLDRVIREFDREKAVVMQERRERVDNDPMGQFYERFMAEAFGSHPYGEPVIGSVRDLKALRARDMQKFFQDYYSPVRMVGALVGDLPPQPVLLALLEATFGRLLPTPSPEQEWPAFARDRETTFEMSLPAEPALMIGYPKPTAPAREDTAFDLFQAVFCGGESSQLVKNLVFKHGLASEIVCYSGLPGARLDNLFVIVGKPLPGISLETLKAAIDTEIKAFMAKSTARSELAKARHQLLSSSIWPLETNDGLAQLLSYYETLLGDWRYFVRTLDSVQEIDGQELKRLAHDYLQPDRRVLGFLRTSK